MSAAAASLARDVDLQRAGRVLRTKLRKVGIRPKASKTSVREANMKVAISIVFSAAVLALASGQEQPADRGDVAPPIGLEIGQRVPAFSLTDQFGDEQSNETVNGSRGTVLLFFRSADW